jgi:hypothetical protein
MASDYLISHQISSLPTQLHLAPANTPYRLHDAGARLLQ